MHFSLTIILGVHFLLCQRVCSLSKYSFLENQTLFNDKDDKILEKFFLELRKIYSAGGSPQDVTIFGASEEQQRQIQSSIRNFPYIISTEVKTSVHPTGFHTGSLVFIFIENLEQNMIEEKLKVLASGKSQYGIIMIIYKGIGAEANDISSFLTENIRRDRMVHEFVYYDKNAINLYRPFVDKDCLVSMRSVLIWKPGKDISEIRPFGSLNKLDINGCVITVAVIPSKPQMTTEEYENGSIIIKGGKEGNLVLLIAELLNFTIAVKYPSAPAKRNISIRNIMMNEVASGMAHFGIGRLGQINLKQTNIDFSKSYDYHCVTWAVPRIMKDTHNLIWAEFPWDVWVIIGVVLVLICGIGYIYHNLDYWRSGASILLSSVEKYVGVATTVLDVLSVTLGNPILYVPSTIGFKIMFIIYIWYSTVITTSYKTGLASILFADHSALLITDLEGIIDANLKIGGERYYFNIIKEAPGSSKLQSAVIERFEIIQNNSKLMHRLQFEKDFVCLGLRSKFDHENQNLLFSGKSLNFYVLDSCILNYASVLVFPKKSFLKENINNIIWSAVEFGFLKYWERRGYNSNYEILERENTHMTSREHVRESFENIFIIYLSCLFSCLLVLIIEILTAKFKPKKTKRRIRRGLQNQRNFIRN